ncbi:MAG: LAGLIDADG family homing endonuclease [Nanoarchaeota archaeon]
MKFNDDLAIIHAYLCADGYVIKSKNEKYNYFHIGFRNTNLTLLKDFQKRFYAYFTIKPHLIEGQRCRIGSKELYNKLTQTFGSFYSYEWKMPQLNIELARRWLRAYFDCEAWVTIERHQNRNIGVDCVNKYGLIQIKDALDVLGIASKIKYREKKKIYRLYIYGKENLMLFRKEVGFLHPDKSNKLNEAINDYVDYLWAFPKDIIQLKKFTQELLKEKIRIKKPNYIRVISKEEINLKRLSKLINEFYNVNCLINKSVNGRGTVYYELSINKKDEVQKLINHRIIPNILKS